MLLSKISIPHVQALATLHMVSFDEPWTEHAFAMLLKLPTTIGWCDEKGFILCSHVLDEMEIITFCVHPSCRRQGYGELLLRTMFDYATNMNVSKIFLDVRIDNIGAIQLYKKMGFVENGIRKGYYKTRQGPKDAVCMVYDILR
ncbi:MAG: ribosomal protein S18-alanine N-acetyltransferase [Alphaproteobacteria bacterium]|nr:ribosomal protein S18-alanine N-acetyltransferase [Alphaproteobacteria bacterium]